MKTITVNGVVYPAKEFDFNMICDLQDMGIDLGSKTNSMPLIRAYVAACMDTNKEIAGKELEKHILAVGDVSEAIESIASVMSEMLEESGFFRTLNKTQEENATKSKTAKK